MSSVPHPTRRESDFTHTTNTEVLNPSSLLTGFGEVPREHVRAFNEDKSRRLGKEGVGEGRLMLY